MTVTIDPLVPLCTVPDWVWTMLNCVPTGMKAVDGTATLIRSVEPRFVAPTGLMLP